MKEEDEKNLQPELSTLSCKLRALGEMLLFQRYRDPALDEEDVWFGYGSLIRDIGERLEVISKDLDEQNVRKASKRKRGSK